LRLDLLTPLRGKRSQRPVIIPRLHAAAQPLPFLNFLIAQPVRGAIVNGAGILVNLPDPARFALHKLITSGERLTVMHTKREKDLRQASQLFSILVEEAARGSPKGLGGDTTSRKGMGKAGKKGNLSFGEN